MSTHLCPKPISLVSGFQGFKVSRFHPNRDRDRYRDRDRLFTTNSRDGTARVFIHRFTQITQIFGGIARVFGTPGEIPDFHEVSWFHPNRDRDR